MAKGKRRGIAANPMAITLGTWNEKSLLPVGWLFSIWLRLKLPPHRAALMRNLLFQPQSIAVEDTAELTDAKARKKKKVIISDFAVVARKSDGLDHRFVSAEIKYTKSRTIEQLTAAISSQLEQKDDTLSPPGLASDHTLILVTSPSISSRSSLAAIEKSISGNSVLRKVGFAIPESIEDSCVASLYDTNGAGGIYRLKREVKDKNGKVTNHYCWIWVCHYRFISVMLANAILGTSATAQTTADTARLILQPVLDQIDGNLLSLFGRVESANQPEPDYSSPLAEGLSDSLVEPLQPFASLEQFLGEPMVFLTQYYLDSCRTSVSELADEKGGFTWNRLLYRIVEREIGRENWNRNTIPPMPLRIVERNQSGAYQAEPVHVLLQTLRSPKIAILEGHSGSGKSTLLEFLHLTWLDSLQHAGSLSGQTELPLFLRLQLLTPEQIEKLHAPEILSEIFRLPLDSLAILKTSPVCLVIDAFDQIADNDRSIAKFEALANLLKETGFVISRIIVSSRPLYRADLALRKWRPLLNTAESSEDEQIIRVFQMMPPNAAARNAFVAKWLTFLSEIGPQRERQLTVDEFSAWLKRLNEDDDHVEGSKFGEKSILASPLLLSLAIYVFVAKRNLVFDIKSIADLFNAVVETAADNRATLETARFRNWSRSIKKVSEVSWGHIANPENVLGNMFASDALWYLATSSGRGRKPQPEKSVEDELQVEEFDAVDDFPFLVVRENKQAIEFVHPSFQEYFAARWLIDEFFNTGRMPSVTGSQATPGQAGSGMYEGRIGAFAESCLRIGREGFRLLLGCLYRRMRSSEGEAGYRRVEEFLNAIQDELCFQQYLYDAGFLDEATNELQLLDSEINAQFRRRRNITAALVLRKLIAHVFYGHTDPDEMMMSLEALENIAAEASTSPWYKLFAADHVLNRMKAEKDPDNATIRKMKRLYATCRKAEKDFHLDASKWQDIEIPPNSFQVTLRFGHFFGHLGNHTLGSTVPSDWDEGIDHFSRAILFRVIDASLTLTDSSFSKLASITTDLNQNKWYKKWISGKHRTVPVDFEGFVGPSQAFGDTAQQYCARSHLYFNKFIHLEEQRLTNLELARQDQQRANQLWMLALEPDGIDTSGGLKYFVYTVALSVRVQMIDDWIKGSLGALQAYQKKTQRDLEEAESTIGFHYQQSRGIAAMIQRWHKELQVATASQAPG